MRLVLIRHGRSAHVNGARWVDVAGVQRWVADYDAAGIAPDDAPPPALAEQAAHAEFLVASDMARAIESAERLAAGRPVLHSPLLREMPVEIPAWMPLRWPMGVWEACIHLQWVYKFARGMDAPLEERRRAAAATKWLTRLAHEGSPVVVTHGLFRRLLATHLVASGWQPESGLRSYGHWSAWTFRTGVNGTSE
ncbi:MAG: histidine phosphatase family protein [Gemmatimonadaceae bacterium]